MRDVLIPLSADGLARTRFVISRLWNVATSLMVLRYGSSLPFLTRWRADAMRELPAEIFSSVSELAKTPGHLPDYLTPPWSGVEHEPTWEQELTCLRNAPEEAVALEYDGPLPPNEYLEMMCSVLDSYYRVAVEPWWPQLRDAARADVARLSATWSAKGATHMFGELHPDVTWDGVQLRVRGACQPAMGVPDASSGVLLVPTLFCWSGVHVLSTPPFPVTLAYGMRGAGSVVAAPEHGQLASWERLLGAGKARVFLSLGQPMTTTNLAHALGLRPSTVSGHVKALEGVGLVAASRLGREVLYRHTPGASDLLRGSGAAGTP